MTVTSQRPDIPDGKMTMTIDAIWLGPCAADQKPGDVIMSNGTKINIPETENRSIAPGVPQPSRWQAKARYSSARTFQVA